MVFIKQHKNQLRTIYISELDKIFTILYIAITIKLVLDPPQTNTTGK